MNRPPVIFVVKQPQAGADGGTASVGEIITRLREHRPIVVADRLSARVEEWRSRGIETHILPQIASCGLVRDPLGVIGSYVRYTRALRRLIAESGAKVLHANDPGALQLALPSTSLSRVAKILNLRDTLDPARRPPRRRFRFLFGAADHVFFLSRDMADRWAAVASNAKRAHSVTYSIVDPERFRAAPPYRGDGPPVVLLSGLIRPKKGQLDFLRNVTPVLASRGISTWLAGDFEPSRDSYMAACAEAAAPFGEAVRFLGFRTDVPELMARSAVVAVASRHEGLVRTMIEAMAAARPVVSFDVCSAREILEEEAPGSGTVVRAGEYAAMAEALLRFCRDPAAAEQAGKSGHAVARRLFDPDAVVSRYERVYQHLSRKAS